MSFLQRVGASIGWFASILYRSPPKSKPVSAWAWFEKRGKWKVRRAVPEDEKPPDERERGRPLPITIGPANRHGLHEWIAYDDKGISASGEADSHVKALAAARKAIGA